MITEEELKAAIAVCKGERNPNANTCMKLAAYYTILNVDYPSAKPDYSYSPAPINNIEYQSGSEFSQAVNGKPTTEIMAIMDELMTVIQVLKPNLYEGVIRKLHEI